MRITGIHTRLMRIPFTELLRAAYGARSHASYLLVTIETDEGIVGYGEHDGLFYETAEAFIHSELKPLLIGEDPLHIEFLAHKTEHFLLWNTFAAYPMSAALRHRGEGPGSSCLRNPGRPVSRQDGYYRGRGNGWALLGLADTLAGMPAGIEGRDSLLANFQSLAAALRDRRADSGDWHTVLDHPEIYLEPSIASFVCAAFLKAMRAGLLDSSFQECTHRSWHACTRAISEGGQLFVSEATPALRAIEEHVESSGTV